MNDLTREQIEATLACCAQRRAHADAVVAVHDLRALCAMALRALDAVKPCGYCGDVRGECSPPGCDVEKATEPAPGFVRASSYVLIGADGQYIVWERDTTTVPTEDGEWMRWKANARRVDFTVDVPIPAPVVGRVVEKATEPGECAACSCTRRLGDYCPTTNSACVVHGTGKRKGGEHG